MSASAPDDDGSASISSVSSVNSSEVSSVHTSDLSASEDGSSSDSSSNPPMKKRKTVKKKKKSSDPPPNRPLELPKGATWEDVKRSQEHLYIAPLPTRDEDGFVVFADAPDFRPNLTPAEVLRRGSFGGGYFRTIKSAVTGMVHKDAHKEFPKSWFEGVGINSMVTNNVYRPANNRYGKKCGQTLEQWEDQGWMEPCDPFGWFQWYCRFYMGRRCYDDERQLGRAKRCFGPTGRWRNRLAKMVNDAGAKHSDTTISPVIRQTLQHWGYRLTKKEYLDYCDWKGLTP